MKKLVEKKKQIEKKQRKIKIHETPSFPIGGQVYIHLYLCILEGLRYLLVVVRGGNNAIGSGSFQ